MPMRSPGGGKVAGVTGAAGFARAGRVAGLLALVAMRRTGAFFAAFFATFLRAAGRLAGAFLALAFAFFLRTAMFSLLAGMPACTCYSCPRRASNPAGRVARRQMPDRSREEGGLDLEADGWRLTSDIS